MTHEEFLKRYAAVLGEKFYGEARSQCGSVFTGRGWSTKDAVLGNCKVHLSERVWRELEGQLRSAQGKSLVEDSSSMMGKMSSESTRPGWYTSGGEDSVSLYDDTASHYESEFEATSPGRRSDAIVRGSSNDVPLRDLESGVGARGPSKDDKAATHHIIEAKVENVKPPKKKMTGSRCRWLGCTWLTTWWIPYFFLSMCGKMKTRDRQMAWREKFTLCVIILLMNAGILFAIVGIGQILCPRKPQLSPGEISSLNKVDQKGTVHMYGNYYVMPKELIARHNDQGYTYASNAFWEDAVLGKDVSQMFRKDGMWDKYCNGVTGAGGRKAFSKPSTYDLFPNPADGFAITPNTWSTHGPPFKNEDFLDRLGSYRKGQVVWDVATIVERQQQKLKYVIAYDNVYEVTSFYEGVYGQTNQNFLGLYTKSLFDKYSLLPGADATADFDYLKRNRYSEWVDVMTCMQGMLYVGKIDHRNDVKCTGSNYILMVASCILVAVIGFKFLAALQFGGKRVPEEHDKFVICQVPCYTEVSIVNVSVLLIGVSDVDSVTG